jgi:hypothetical protein
MHIWDFNKGIIACLEIIDDTDLPDPLIRRLGRQV